MNASSILEQSRSALELIAGSIYEPIAPLECECFSAREPLTFERRQEPEGRRVTTGEQWAETGGEHAWLHFTGTAPINAAGYDLVALIDAAGELLIVDAAGNPDTGLSAPIAGGPCVLPLIAKAQGGEELDFWADCTGHAQPGRINALQLALVQPNIRELYYDQRVLTELAERLPEHSARRACIVFALARAVQALNSITDERASHARFLLLSELARRAADVGLVISAAGGIRLDITDSDAQGLTRRAALRAFAGALETMERYDDCTVSMGQAQLYRWMKDDSPLLYERVREKVRAGRWEPCGGMWVDADVRIASGEALARQMIYGKRFFARELGQDATVMYLPGACGGPAQLPQLMKLAGMKYALSMRASRNGGELDLPHDSFLWQGLDGTRILTHIPPTSPAPMNVRAHANDASPSALLDAERLYSEAGITENVLLTFETRESNLEMLKRERDLSGIAPSRQERVCDFFARLERTTRQTLPVWSGELLAGECGGTYTSQQRLKASNRALENKLRVCDLVFAAMQLRGDDIPRAQLDALWRRALVCQSAAILSGAAAESANDTALSEYAAISRELDALTLSVADGTPGLDMMVNPHAWTIDEWIVRDGELRRIQLPPLSSTSISQARQTPPPQVGADAFALENDRLKLSFDERGRLVAIYDKRGGWNVLRGVGNQLSVYQDDGDAVRIGSNTLARKVGAFALAETTCRLEGPYSIRESVYRFGKSSLKQQVRICAGSSRVDFITSVDWGESGKLLRAEFPLDITAGRYRCDVQFGYAERPTARNTPRDESVSEGYAHKWADLSQSDRGAALMSTGGYGCSCADNLLSLNLLRAPSSPDAHADRASHHFTYALYPHEGDLPASDAARQAYEFHQPPTTMPCAQFGPLAWLDNPNIVIETVKCAEDSRDIVFRMYEAHGGSRTAHLKLGFAPRSASEADLLERAVESLECVGGEIALSFAPFEIKTVIVSKQQ